MDSPNNWGDQAPIRHLSSPNEVSIVRNGLHLIELLTKEVPWEPARQLSRQWLYTNWW